ncbi:4Fe-4S binding protein [Streptacidiphilus jiangxiensis]|uniref:ferredoxin--NADP(+) reductase n=1 Tax=Streptacidiphilus jiangxiensis TaxID=235985 RepID=A0A1H7QMA9_STRJI|nr:4Fe-4S binding protein [Streptacidiphilus jiangxiensis]SEL48979.1 ferredoxin--NADP+ reductase [Streptacidiphilus jiangxiensis]
MAYAITRTCCNDASCVSVCPVNCIHPTPGEPGFGTTDMLYIDPAACIDCGACADACPVDAIFPVDRLAGPDAPYAELNRRWYEQNPTDHAWGAPDFPRSLPDGFGELTVAVVGTGPSAGYTAQLLLRTTGARVTMIDRLPVAGGLLRHGVAPDHQSTKRIGESFATTYHHPALRMHLGVAVGEDVTHEDLTAHHHAVVYAVGAAGDRRLGLPGEDLPGSLPATTLVGWYNAHPGVPADAVDLGAHAERVVVIGNGNVAVDIARILLSDPDDLARTDIADHALAALRDSRVREVVLLARRGPEHAAWSEPEFLALAHLAGAELVVADEPGVREAIAAAASPGSTGSSGSSGSSGSKAALLVGLPVEAVDWAAAPPPGGRRIVLRFGAVPTELLGHARVEGLRVTGPEGADGNADGEGGGSVIATGLVVRSIGYRGVPVPGLPFDETSGTIPHDGGRVVDPATGLPLSATYVVGWAKRGPSGGIGANRDCAQETVDALLDDAAAWQLPTPAHPIQDFAHLVRRRQPEALGLRQWRAVDRTERARGEETGRPRVKLATVPELLASARRFRR